MYEMIIGYVLCALKKTYENDAHLIKYPSVRGNRQQYHVGERAIVFRTAHYLQNMIEESDLYEAYNLDVEYNRNNDHPKYLEIDTKRRCAPDIIIHKRTSNDDNLLVIEFKGYWCKDQQQIELDKRKLCGFTNQSGIYRFKIGLLVLLGKNINEAKMIVFEDNKIIGIRRIE